MECRRQQAERGGSRSGKKRPHAARPREEVRRRSVSERARGLVLGHAVSRPDLHSLLALQLRIVGVAHLPGARERGAPLSLGKPNGCGVRKEGKRKEGKNPLSRNDAACGRRRLRRRHESFFFLLLNSQRVVRKASRALGLTGISSHTESIPTSSYHLRYSRVVGPHLCGRNDLRL